MSRLNHTSSMEGAFAYFRTQGLKLAGSSQENWELTEVSVFVWSNIDDFKICVKTVYFVMIHINCDSLWTHIQVWQLTLDWMFQAHASMHQDDCPPVVLYGNSQNIATMPYFLLGILRWWSQPEAASFKRLCCWVVKLQSVANIEEFPKMCKIDSRRSLEHYCKVCMSMIFEWSTKTSLSKI